MILLTGATGFVGRSVARQLSQSGQAWRAFDGRINNYQHLRQQLAGVTTVIHLVGSEARSRNRLLQHIDLEGTERLLEEARRADVRHLIYLSRIGADHNSSHWLLRIKGEVERLVRQSGLPYTILRCATLFGQDDRFTELMAGLAIWSWPFVWLPGGGQVAMQPLWVEDAARCLVTAVSRPDLHNQTLTLAGEERLRYRDIIRHILLARNMRLITLPIPLVLLRPLSALIFSWWYWPAVGRYFVDRFFVPEVADLDSVLRQFHFRPAHLDHTLAYLRRPGLRWRLFRH